MLAGLVSGCVVSVVIDDVAGEHPATTQVVNNSVLMGCDSD